MKLSPNLSYLYFDIFEQRRGQGSEVEGQGVKQKNLTSKVHASPLVGDKSF
jgi:hypothetical protein